MKEKKQTPSIRRKKPILPVVLILIAAIVLAILPRIAERKNVEENTSIVSAQAAAAQIDTVIHAAGALADREAESISVPEDVKLNFVVKNGDTVKAGDLIAAVDKTSLMITIAQLQENLDSMDKKIEEAMDESAASKMEAPATGRVKAIYAQEGENVTDVMHEHGALAVLSLNGSMALDMTWSDAKVGAAVQVTLADGTEVSGKVDSLSGNTATVILSDEKAALGETVSVADGDGNVIGGGELYIHKPLAVTGYYGQVGEIHVQLDEKLDAGDTMMALEGAETTAGYAGLLSQRQKMEEQMTMLFNLYQTGGLFAESDGIVAEISEEDNLEAVMAAQASYSLRAMVNSPDGQEGYTNYAAQVTGIDGVNLSMNLCPMTISDMDYADAQLLDSLPYTQITGYTLAENTPVYVSENGTWVLKDLNEIKTGDKLILAFGENRDMPVWIVCHHAAQNVPEVSEPVTTPIAPSAPSVPDGDGMQLGGSEPVTTPTAPASPSVPDEDGTQPGGSETATAPTVPNMPETEQQKPESGDADVSVPNTQDGSQTQTMPQMQQGMQNGTGSGFGAFTGGSVNVGYIVIPEMEAAADLILTEKVAYTLTPDTDMTVELMIDEMDLARIQLGQEVSLVLDAIPDKPLTAEVTAISDTSDSESGSAKYAVEIKLERLLEMRTGMNVAVTIPVSTTEAACAVPAAALVEKDGKTWVYTDYDRENDVLGGLVEVTTGVSDGETVELFSGLKVGDTVYYSYTEVIEYEFVQ